MTRQFLGTPGVLPYPRSSIEADEAFAMGRVRTGNEPAAAAKAIAALRAGLATAAGPATGAEIVLNFATDTGLETRHGEEAYTLNTDASGMRICAGGEAGFYYGVQTLLQLRKQTDGSTVSCPAVQITDWPLKPIRGVHTYLPAREDLPFFKRFIEWMGRHKLNTLFLEIGGGMAYARHPEINAAWEAFCAEAMAYPGGPCALQNSQCFPKNSTHTELAGGSFLTQSEVRQIREWCTANCVEIVPEAQSLSHAYYLVLAHPELAEAEADPWPDNYCPSNPESYKLFFDVLEEVVDVLDPGTISIGHDEAYIFKFCPKCQTRDAAEIYASDITASRDFLAARGIRTAIWGDKLLEIHHPNGVTYGGVERNLTRYGKAYHQPATNRCVEMIPRDVLILDWYWSLSYESAEMLAEKGFEMIYGNYHGPRFRGWAKHRDNPALLGGETSLWCAANYRSIGRNGSFHNILWSANNLWSDVDPDVDPDRLRRDIAATMRRDRPALAHSPCVVRPAVALQAAPVDLTPAAAGGLYPGETPEFDLRALPRGAQVLGGVPFSILADAEQSEVLPMVDWHRAACPPIPIERAANALVFVHTMSVERVHAPTYYSLLLGPNVVGHYLVTYEDGSSVEIPLECGRNIDVLNSRFMTGKSGDQSATLGVYAHDADPVLVGETDTGAPYTVFMYEWVNPRPTTPVRDLRLLWDGGYTKGVIALIAVTAVQSVVDPEQPAE